MKKLLLSLVILTSTIGFGVTSAGAAKPEPVPNMEGKTQYHSFSTGMLCDTYHGILLTSDSTKKLATANFYWGTGYWSPSVLYGTGIMSVERVERATWNTDPPTLTTWVRKGQSTGNVTCSAGMAMAGCSSCVSYTVSLSIINAPVVPTQQQIDASITACQLQRDPLTGKLPSPCPLVTT